MKNLFKLKTILRIAGIIAIAAVIGFSMAACGDDNGGGGGPGGYGPGGGGGGGSSATIIGTWEDEAFGWNKFEFTSTSWTYYFMGYVMEEGYYTISGNTVTLFTASGDKPNFSNAPNTVIIVNSNTIRWGVDDFHRAR